MNGYLLDTNIISELRKKSECHARVRRWFEKVPSEELYLSVLVTGEIRRGIERIRTRDQLQARALDRWLQCIVSEFGERILPVDHRIADEWGRLGIAQPVPVLDALLAATAISHQLTMVSRNVDDFRRTGVRVLNPFVT